MTLWAEALVAALWLLGMPTSWETMDPDTSDPVEAGVSMALTLVWPLTVLTALVIHAVRAVRGR